MSKNNRYRYLIKNIGILTISNFASKIMVFLLVPLYTSVLSAAEYGTYDLVVSTVQLLFPLLTLNITDAVMRFLMDKTKSIDAVASIGVRYIGWSFIPAGIFLLACNRFQFGMDINGFEILIFLYFVFYILNQFLIQFSKGLEKVFDMGIAGVLGTVILLGGNILFLLYFKLGLTGFFVANILSQALPSMYFFIRLKVWKYIKKVKIDKDLQIEMLMYCVPLLFSTVGWWVNNASDKYVVAFLCGAAANGILSVAYKIPSILNTLQNIFIQAWQISAIKEYGGEEAKKFYGSAFMCLNILICIVAAFLILLSRPVASILYAKDFYVAWKYVPFLLISSALNSASGFLGPILSAAKDSKSMAKSAIYGAIVNAMFNIVLVYLMGIQGATIATVFSSYVIYAVRKKSANDKIQILSYWKIYVTWALLCVQAICEISTVGYAVEIFIILFIIVINYSVLLKLVCSVKSLLLRMKK